MTQLASQSPPAQPPRPRGKVWLRLLIGLPLLGLVWYFVGRSLAAGFRQIDWTSLHINWLFVVATVLVLIVIRLTHAMNTRHVLGAMGEHVTYGQVVPIFWVASLGRYIPGKVAVVAGAMFMLVRLGIRVPVAAASLFLSTALMILLGTIASAPLMFMPAVRQKMPWGWVVSLGLMLVGIVCLHPHVFTRLVNIVLKKVKRAPLPQRLALSPYFRALGVTVLRIVMLGLGLWCAARCVYPIGIKHLPLAMASGGLASVAGFLAVFAPAGLGVHEGIYLITMGPIMGPQAALMAVLFRFFSIISDAITGAAGMAMLKGQRAAAVEPADVRS